MKRFTTHRSATQIDMSKRAAREYEARRLAETRTRRLYKTAAWARLRAVQLAGEPLCRQCQSEGVIRPASVCDHIDPHRGDVERFWAGPFQSLCEGCHNRTKQRQERASP
jgi:5-methylcytosine-specific restriction endonuclease McrA